MPTLYRAAGGSPSDLGGIDGMDMWDALIRNRWIPLSWHWGNGQWTMRVFELFATISRDSPRNLMLHNIDEQREIAAVITNRQKQMQMIQKKIWKAKIPKIGRVNTGEGWRLEVGEGHNIRRGLGQLVLLNICKYKYKYKGAWAACIVKYPHPQKQILWGLDEFGYNVTRIYWRS